MRLFRGVAFWVAVGCVLTGLCAEEQRGQMELLGTNVVSLGTYPNTEDRVVRVQLKNIGASPLRIVRVVMTCKCMKLGAFPEVLAAGETGDVYVTIAKNELAGAFEKIFIIESDDSVTRSIKVKIAGYAKPLFLVTCDAKTALGPVDPGTVWTGKFTVAATEAGISLGSPAIQDRGAQSDYTTRTNRQDGLVYEVARTVTFHGEGILESALVFPILRVDGGTSLPVRLMVEAVRKRPIKAVPDRIQVSLTAVPLKRRLLLTIDSATPLELGKLSWKTNVEGLEVQPQLSKSGKGFMVTLTFPAASVSTICNAGGEKMTFLYGDWPIDVPIQSGN